MSKNRKNGFTLIELLAVIIILGILMIIAIPSVTSYINNSRKSAYVDTAKEIVAGARNFVNEGKLEMYATDTTYYIPASCIGTENGQKSPYGEFAEAYVLVTFNGKGYKYYWVSRDETGQGVKDPIEIGELKEDDIKSDIPIDYIKTNVTKDGTSNIVIIDESNCNGFKKIAAPTILATAKAADQLNRIQNTDIYIFKGGTTNSPSNYVTFNGETWRIIGIYGEQLKIVNVSGFNRAWNSSKPTPKWSNSSLMTYLNGTYYNSLSSEAKEMIDENGSWNVGAVADNATASQAYTSATTTSTVGSVTHTTPWTGKVGILASYEFLYAARGNGCDNVAGSNGYFTTSCGKLANDWLLQNQTTLVLLINAYTGDAERVVSYRDPGYVTTNVASVTYRVLPTVFLKPSVKLISGDGTLESPYVLQ